MRIKRKNSPFKERDMKFAPSVILLLFFGISAAGADDQKPAASVNDGGEAQFQLGRAYLRGEGVPKDVEKALELMKSAAAQGNTEALGGVGYFYSNGIAVPKDDKQATEWFRKGAEKGSAKAQLNLGKTLLSNKKESDSKDSDPILQEALQWIKKAADQGLPEAGLTYARILFYGDYGTSKDYEKAIDYLKPGCETGIADAQNMLGAMYEAGNGVSMDVVSAKSWYRKAAMQGYAKAQRNLGTLIGPLVGNKEDRIEALAWLLIASDQLDVPAQKTLADTVPSLKPGELDDAKLKASELRMALKK